MYIVIGLGKTGLSVIRYLAKQNIACLVCDSRKEPPGLAQLKNEFPDIPCVFGELPEVQLLQAEKIILSPGLPRTIPVIAKALENNIPVIGDIELFVQQAKAPIIAITGTNAKGTVTTMTGSILAAAGFNVLLGGNIGTPALELLDLPEPDYYILELSSFQLESTFSLKAAAATVLNVSDDHLDYHGSIQNYIAAKRRIYQSAQAIIFNADDPNTQVNTTQLTAKLQWSYGLKPPSAQQAFGVMGRQLMLHDQVLVNVDELAVAGTHNWLNALAAAALATAVGVSLSAICEGLKNFRGLPHRCELVSKHHGVSWFDDSKGTNVGATQAALIGLGPTIAGKIVLIAGGQAKGQDFQPLQPLCQKYVKTLILFGQDAAQLELALADYVQQVIRVKDLVEAVAQAEKISQVNDIVLLSPACASLDMFKDYADRGEQFAKRVKDLNCLK